MERILLAPGCCGAPPELRGLRRRRPLTEGDPGAALCRVCCSHEVEKAHPRCFNLLLQVLDDGRLTDSQGTHRGLPNTVVVMTRQPGQRAISERALSGPAATAKGKTWMAAL